MTLFIESHKNNNNACANLFVTVGMTGKEWKKSKTRLGIGLIETK